MVRDYRFLINRVGRNKRSFKNEYRFQLHFILIFFHKCKKRILFRTSQHAKYDDNEDA